MHNYLFDILSDSSDSRYRYNVILYLLILIYLLIYIIILICINNNYFITTIAYICPLLLYCCPTRFYSFLTSYEYVSDGKGGKKLVKKDKKGKKGKNDGKNGKDGTKKPQFPKEDGYHTDFRWNIAHYSFLYTVIYNSVMPALKKGIIISILFF